jgi:broad specificity phosphatase PhoE
MKTVVLLRHADVDDSPAPAPATWPLNAAGLARAQELARILGDAGVGAVFVSPALRTQQTAQPLASRLGLQPQPVDDVAVLAQAVRDAVASVVLVVGHSNTIPELVTTLGLPLPSLLQGHGDLFVLTLDAGTSLLRLKYGSPSPLLVV